MELFLVPNFVFQFNGNLSSVFIGLPIGIIVGVFYSIITNNWENISLEKYNSIISGN
jgi:phosphotransferase system  glucose/maltose/N-acetylglucosamine-specific IIC component